MEGADGVYPSSEDTHLLIDALTADLPMLRSNLPQHPTCIEIGCGSGEVTLSLTTVLPDAALLATDVNELAVAKTTNLLRQSGKSIVDVLISDLFKAFTPSTRFDVIVFNPPYVPTDQLELERALKDRDIAASWAGGRDGRQVIDVFLRTAPLFLSKSGFIYLVALQSNDPTQMSRFAEDLGLKSTVVLERHAGFEHLYVLRFQNSVARCL